MRTSRVNIVPAVSPIAEYVPEIGDRPDWIALDIDGVTTQFWSFEDSRIVASITEDRGCAHLHLTVAQAEAMIATLQAAVERSKGEAEPFAEYARRRA